MEYAWGNFLKYGEAVEWERHSAKNIIVSGDNPFFRK
jgi:hypothetical protein